MKMIDRNSSLRVLSELELAQVCGGSDEEGEEIVVTGTRLKFDNSFSWADFGGGAGWGPTSYAGFAGIGGGGGGGGGPTLEYDWTALSDSDDDGIEDERDPNPYDTETSDMIVVADATEVAIIKWVDENFGTLTATLTAAATKGNIWASALAAIMGNMTSEELGDNLVEAYRLHNDVYGETDGDQPPPTPNPLPF